ALIQATSKPDVIASVSAIDHDGGGTQGPGYDGKLRVSFGLPQANGAGLRSVEFEVTGGPSGSWPVGNTASVGTPFTQDIGGLTNGTGYRVRVRACNEKDCADWSDYSGTATPYGKPGVPTANASVNVKDITWSWSGGGDNGRPISHYHVCFDDGSCMDPAGPGSVVKQYDYEQDHSVTVTFVDTAGQESAGYTKSARTVNRPNPTITGAAKNMSRPTVCDSTGTTGCYWVDFDVHDFQLGTFNIICRFNDGDVNGGPITVTSPDQHFSPSGCHLGSGYTLNIVINGVTSNPVS
ncbi:MAG: Fibronectin type domain protein, partial [Frankiales bacterium]|nr:Fibronectin type domain protein [Frankiales bacterium]